MVYRTGLTFGRDGDNQLAYAVEVTNGANVRDMLYLNAGSGKLLNRWYPIAVEAIVGNVHHDGDIATVEA